MMKNKESTMNRRLVSDSEVRASMLTHTCSNFDTEDDKEDVLDRVPSWTVLRCDFDEASNAVGASIL